MSSSAASLPDHAEEAPPLLPPATRAFCLDCATAQHTPDVTACVLCGSDFLSFTHKPAVRAPRPPSRARRNRRAR